MIRHALQMNLALAVAWALISQPATAAFIDDAASTVGGTYEDFSSAGQLSFDATLVDGSVSTFTVQVENGDLPGPLPFEAVLTNGNFQENWVGLNLVLSGATFSTFGDVTAQNTTASVSTTASSLAILFDPAEPAGVELGGVFPFGGQDFAIDLGGLAPGATFSLAVQPVLTPVPAGLALFASGVAGLGGISLLRARRKHAADGQPA